MHVRDKLAAAVERAIDRACANEMAWGVDDCALMVSPLWDTAQHGVGGEIVMAKITRDEISIRVIHRWPDEVGRPIRT